MSNDAAAAWNDEYRQQGIPSSHREDPSGVLIWAMQNIPFTSDRRPVRVVDLGCGTGRNSVALADQGFEVEGIDFSEVALDIARNRPGAESIRFLRGDLSDPLPYETEAFDFAADIFAYFHLLSDDTRKRYRQELHRVLRPGGTLLVSLATEGDGYYGACKALPSWEECSTLRLTWDPHAEVGNILPTLEQFLAEFDDFFDLQMVWRKRKDGLMHGQKYLRETVATIWHRS